MTKLQSKLKWAVDNSKLEADYETWKKAIFEYGILCYVKARQNKLYEVDYKGRYRKINKGEK
jgi:hypothetical protein